MGMLKLHSVERRASRSPTRSSRRRSCTRPGSSAWSAPTRRPRSPRTFLRWGASPATGVATAAHQIPARDDADRRTRLAQLRARSTAAPTPSPTPSPTMGIGLGDGVGIMCRNHRGFIEATLAAAKLGASALYLNTMFAGPQLVEVTRARGAEGARLRRGVRRPARRRRRGHRRGSSPGATARPRGRRSTR